jgi:hypothetical protein
MPLIGDHAAAGKPRRPGGGGLWPGRGGLVRGIPRGSPIWITPITRTRAHNNFCPRITRIKKESRVKIRYIRVIGGFLSLKIPAQYAHFCVLSTVVIP